MENMKHVRSYHEGHPNPQRYRENWTSLNGEWKFAFDEKNEGLLKQYQKDFPSDCLKINAPYPYQSPKSGIDEPHRHCEVIWYEREIEIREEGKAYLLTFNAVDYKTALFVNGEYVLTHEGGYDEFSVDIAPYVHLGSNKITLRVEDGMDIDQIRGKQRWRDRSFTCFYTETSGIVRDVYLETLEKDHIKDFSLRGDYSSSTLEVEAKVVKKGILMVEVSSREGALVKSERFPVEPGDNRFSIAFNEVRGWSHEDPYLYDVRLVYECGGEKKDEIDTYCGFISFKTEGKNFLVNGKDTYLKLVLNQGYWEDTITTPTEEEIIGDAEFTLACGFNGARMHEHTPSSLAFYYMDLYGLYAWQECPSAGAYSYKSCRQYFKQFPRLIHQYASHPCIIAYVLFNESWGVNEIHESDEIQEVTDRMYHLVKPASGGRMVISNDGWEHTVSDVITFHNYLETYEELSSFFEQPLKDIQSGKNAECVKNFKNFFAGDYRYNGQPIMLSEFAGIAFTKDERDGWGYGKGVASEEDFLCKYSGMLRFIAEHKEIRGFCMTQLTDVYQEKNGLLTMGRKEKVSPAVLKAMHDKFA